MGLEDLYFFLVASIKFLLEFSDFVVDVAFESVESDKFVLGSGELRVEFVKGALHHK